MACFILTKYSTFERLPLIILLFLFQSLISSIFTLQADNGHGERRASERRSSDLNRLFYIFQRVCTDTLTIAG